MKCKFCILSIFTKINYRGSDILKQKLRECFESQLHDTDRLKTILIKSILEKKKSKFLCFAINIWRGKHLKHREVMYTKTIQKMSESFNSLITKYQSIAKSYEFLNKKYDGFVSKVFI